MHGAAEQSNEESVQASHEQERILARSPSAGGMPATDGSASCAAKWCSSYCHDRYTLELNRGDQIGAPSTFVGIDGLGETTYGTGNRGPELNRDPQLKSDAEDEYKPEPRGPPNRQERIPARSPSVGGMPATDGSACCAAKWCSSYCRYSKPGLSLVDMAVKERSRSTRIGR